MERNKLDEYKIIDEIKITTSTLTEAFKKHLPHEPKIDFMSIDVEGFDLNVLKSNDWKNYRPEFVLVEDLNFDLMSPTKSDVFNYLIDKNYKLVAKSYNTLFFRDKV